MSNLLATPLKTRPDQDTPPTSVYVNLLLYQMAWLACVLGAAAGRPAVGVIASSAVVAIRLWLAPDRLAEMKILVLTGLIGSTWEYLLVGMDWVRYQGAGHGWPPLWIVALWLAFATTFNGALRPLQTRPVLAGLLGLAGGPLAWWAAARLGALELPEPDFSLFAIGVGWMGLMPLLMTVAARTRRSASTPAVAEG